MQQRSNVTADVVWRLIREHGDEAAIVPYAHLAYSASARHEASTDKPDYPLPAYF